MCVIINKYKLTVPLLKFWDLALLACSFLKGFLENIFKV